METNLIQENFRKVVERIGEAAYRARRDPAGVRLVVVTKTHPLETVRAALGAGARYLGENYAEEATPKIQALAGYPGVEWHMIGHIQSRKARLVCEQFNYVHSLDSLRLAQRLDRAAAEARRKLPVLLECNVSGESTKFGFQAWEETRWAELLPELEVLLGCTNLEVRGLMTMAPYLDAPEQARPYFQRLRQLRDYLAGRFPGNRWDELSMGMSGDFEAAIEEGATWVRIGSAILGPRLYS